MSDAPSPRAEALTRLGANRCDSCGEMLPDAGTIPGNRVFFPVCQNAACKSRLSYRVLGDMPNFQNPRRTK